MVKSAYLTQEYTGVIEVIDNVLKYFDKADDSELLKNGAGSLGSESHAD